MVQVDSIRRLLAAVDAEREPYLVAEVAMALLNANPQDEAGRGHYVRALSALKLIAAAHRVVGQNAGTGGLIAWKSRARRFEANLKALEVRHPAAAELVRAAAGRLAEFELHQSGDGNFQVLGLSNGAGAWNWMPTLSDHKAATGLWKFDRSKHQMLHPLAFDGLGFGWLFLHMLATTERTFLDYSCAMYVLEQEPLNLAMLFHMHDLQSVLAQPRVRMFVGQGAAAVMEQFQNAFLENPTWSVPAQFVRCPLIAATPLPLDQMISRLGALRTGEREAHVAAAKAYYARKDAAFWHERFEQAANGGPPLRVLAMTSRYTTVLQHSIAEMAGAMRDAGCEVRLAIEPDDQSLENPYLQEIAEFKPDLMVQLSRMRYENPNLPANVPFLCWDQDNLPCMRTAEATASMTPLTYVAGHGACFGYANLKWPRANSIFCHAAAATRRYHPAPAPGELLAKHACDISYVSNASGSPAALAAKLRERWAGAPNLVRLFDALTQELLAKSAAGETYEHVAIRNMVRARAAETQTGIEERAILELTIDLNTFADRAYRHTALEWVSRWCAANNKTLRLYGSGWEAHPEFGRWAAGHAPPGEEARAIFQASRINLQLIQPGFIHSRSLDGLAAGGFFLTRHTVADGVNSEEIAALYRLARHVREHKIERDGDLERIGDPEIRRIVPMVRAYYERHEVAEALFSSLQIWADMPAPAILFPRLGEITFGSEGEFGALAGRYLGDDALRESVAADFRETVQKHFSYDARWREFVSAIRAGLDVAAAKQAGLVLSGAA